MTGAAQDRDVDGPLVSVIMATRNRAERLPRSVGSVLRQSYPRVELVIVDDASTDNTPEVVAAFGDPRIRYLRLERNIGVSAARNAGVRAAQGVLVAFQDDDDEWIEHKLARQVDALGGAGPGVGVNLCGHIGVYPHGEVYVGGAQYFANVQPEAGYGNLALIATPGWLVRRDLLFAAGLFDERIHTLEDWELALRLAEYCRFSHLDEALYRKDRLGEDRLSKDQRLLADALEMIMVKHGHKWVGNPAVLSRHYYVTGRARAQSGDLVAARRMLWQAVRHRPLNIMALALLCTSLAGSNAIRRISRLRQGLIRARTRSGMPRA